MNWELKMLLPSWHDKQIDAKINCNWLIDKQVITENGWDGRENRDGRDEREQRWKRTENEFSGTENEFSGS
jgi:hypothetical protein